MSSPLTVEPAHSSSRDIDDTLVGALVLALASLRALDRVVPPASWIRAQIREAMTGMPPQHRVTAGGHPADDWIVLASFADYVGAFDIAWAMFEELDRLLINEAQQEDRSHTSDESTVSLRALTLARRGRIARQRGDVEDAIEWYKDGLRTLRNAPRETSWAQCVLGLANCAQARGNFPEVIRRCRSVLRVHPALPVSDLCSAHHALALCYRRYGNVDLALHHAWTAFELVRDEPDDRRAQCLVGVAEITLQLGHAAAARNGFQVMLTQPQPERIRIPALAGLLAAETQLWQRTGDSNTDSIRAGLDRLLHEVGRCLQPYERVKGMLAALETAIAIGWWERARELHEQLGAELRAASDAGTSFHEYAHQHDVIGVRLEEMEQAGLQSAHQDALGWSASHRVRPRTRRAVSRLAALKAFTAHDVR